MINIGDCFTLHSHGKPHLHIVIQDQRPGEIIGQVICVYSCSIGLKTRYDPRTILRPGDHSFFTEPSYIKYDNASIEVKSDLEKRILKRWGPINNQILEAIQSGFTAPHRYENVRGDIYTYYNEWHWDSLMKTL